MPNVRQMTEFYLRGSLATVTMTNLTKEEQKHVAEVVEFVANNPNMAPRRNRFISELGATIGGDYRDDRSAADQDYKVAIWRAVVELLYHNRYTFRCRACGSDTYFTKALKPKPIDRRQTPCPHCACVCVKSAGDTDLVVGSYIKHEDFQKAYIDFTDKQRAPEMESSIEAISQGRKYPNPEVILDDPEQLKRFFGEFIWNTFRQEIKENKRETHRKAPQKIVGPAYEVIVEEILSLCARLDVDYNYCYKTQPEDGVYKVSVVGLSTPPEFTAELIPILQRGRECGLDIVITPTTIEIPEKTGSPTISAFVVKAEHVSVLSNNTRISGMEEESAVDQLHAKSIGGILVDTENHVEMVDSNEGLNAVRDALPLGDCQRIFDILSQQGEEFDKFSQKHGLGEARNNHLAEHLKITVRTVKTHKEVIRMHMLAHRVIPKN